MSKKKQRYIRREKEERFKRKIRGIEKKRYWEQALIYPKIITRP